MPEANRTQPGVNHLDLSGPMSPEDRRLMASLGKQATVWAFECDPGAADDPSLIYRVMREYSEANGLTVCDSCETKYQPQGVTVVLVLQESHLLVNTWPEHGVVQVELFSCKGIDIEGLKNIASSVFQSRRTYSYSIE